MLPELCLAPHEVGDLAPGEPLCAPADARIRVETGARRGNYLIRRLQGNNGWIPVAIRREAPTSPLIYVHQDERLPDLEIAKKIRQGKIDRLLYFNSDYRLATSRHAWSFWMGIYDDEKGAANWQLRQGGIVNLRHRNEGSPGRFSLYWKFDTPDEEIERDISRMLSDENSHFSFANRWESLGYREKQRSLTQFARGDMNELKSRLSALIWSFDECDPDVEWRWTLRLGMRREHESDSNYLDEIVCESKLASKSGKYQLSAFQCELLKATLSHLFPRRNAELEDLLKFHNIWQGHGRLSPLPFVIPVATAHERLEARLQLREFLRAQVSPAEFGELMRGF